jgi:hypothetical protein
MTVSDSLYPIILGFGTTSSPFGGGTTSTFGSGGGMSRVGYMLMRCDPFSGHLWTFSMSPPCEVNRHSRLDRNLSIVS